MATKKPKGLGRGLDALLGADVPAIDNIGKAPAAAPEGPPATLPVSKMRAGKISAAHAHGRRRAQRTG